MDMQPEPGATDLRAANRSQLAIRRIGIDTYRENVAYLHRDCAVYRAEGFQALSKISVHADGQRILATLNVVDDLSIVGCEELGLSEDAFAQLGVANGHTASLWHAKQPASIAALQRKIAGERLNLIIQAQGATGFDYRDPQLGKRCFEVLAPAAGVVAGIDNLQLAHIAGLAGAPKVKAAGVDLLCKLGQAVTRDTVLYRVHAQFPADLAFAQQACQASNGFTIGSARDIPQVSVEF